MRKRILSRQPYRVKFRDYLLGSLAPILCCLGEAKKSYYLNEKRKFDKAKKHLEARFDGIKFARNLR